MGAGFVAPSDSRSCRKGAPQSYNVNSKGAQQSPLSRFYWGYIGVIRGLYGDNGKENGNYYIIIGYIERPPNWGHGCKLGNKWAIMSISISMSMSPMALQLRDGLSTYSELGQPRGATLHRTQDFPR